MPLVNGRKFLRVQLPTLVTLLAGERAALNRRPALEPLAPASGISRAPLPKGGSFLDHGPSRSACS